ncbi:hypothetical protein [Nocardia nova]|jgi:hypothetical protein|uniref:hypothetical protein n=1 Tax=Nocardia nova TaxID=37330 RepID=UPI001894E91D|nr:hypothetical protein [Nocardia nova]MBF6144936.1 hypothetical protein [Nocardia nova]MDN2498009.1 hypothetical protein [Nocardia nova]
MTALKSVGIFSEMYRSAGRDLPTLSDSYTTRIIGDREQIADYMAACAPIFDVLEDVVDLVEGREWIRSGPTLVSDGTWIWRLDSIHYLRHYSLDIPQEFLEHVRNREYRPATDVDASAPAFDDAISAYF